MEQSRKITSLGVALSLLGGLALHGGMAAAAGAVARQPAAVKLIEQAGDALGGAARVRNTRNITLVGYAQYAYMFGGGRISGSPEAPEKYIAANDLRRIYDLEHGRFEQLERRNMLFPFLAMFGHSYALNDLVLDGDIAFDRAGGKATRAARWIDGVLQVDGVHMRRMWMLNNPVALVRAAMDPGTSLGTGKPEGGLQVVHLVLASGDKLSAGFGKDHRPAWVRWANPMTDLGQVTFTTHLTGYASIGGLMLPLALDTRLDWRNIDYFKVYVDHYGIDEPIADLSAPAEVRTAPEPESDPVRPVTAEVVAPHIWRLAPNGTTVVEFKDHLVLFELDATSAQGSAIIAAANKLVPGKKATQLVVSHNHFDHAAGLRQAVAEGLTIISKDGNEPLFREMATHAAADFPDEQARRKAPFKFVPVDEKLRLADETMTLDVYWARQNIHMADGVFAHAPAQKVIMEGDIATASFDYQFWPDDLRDLIDYYKLDVQLDSPVHSISREHPGVLTMAQLEELIKGGTQRARERCASELAKGNWFPGCPVWSKRY
jgi:glyoxylase-like metal-dependent hydrolase (beta-lactamase superfamily II)